MRVRIGSAGRSVNPGLHEYVIRYRTTRQIGFFDSYDELYWNVTGNGWTFPIDVAEARINLPDKVEFKQSAFYTGPQGAQGKDATIVEQQPGRIVFRTTRPLPVANGLTVAAGFPKGVVLQPTRMQQFQSMLQDDPALRTAAIGGGVVILFYLLAWLLVGRDPPRGTIIPLFAPPEGMSAAAVRFVEDMTFDDRVFTAAIVGLGVNGHLKLVDRAGDQELHRVKGTSPIDTAEQAVDGALFAKKSTVALSQLRTRYDRRRQVRAPPGAEAGLHRHALSQQFLVVELRPHSRGAGDCGDHPCLRRQLWLECGRHHRRHADPAAADHVRRRHGAPRRCNAAAATARAASSSASSSSRSLWRPVSPSCPITSASVRRSCRPLCRRCSRGWRRSASPGCRRRARKAARSWIRSKASGSTSASPRKTGWSI